MSRYFTLVFLAATLLLTQGCTTNMSKGADRRTEGTYIEDGTIQDVAQERIKKKFQDTVHINVNSYNRKVLITGEVPDEATKTEIFRIVGGVQNVTEIYNEAIIGPVSALSARSGDGITSSNLKYRLRNTEKNFFNSDRVKVVVERDITYLMGLVTRAEADVAKDVASTSRGVKKVVPFFEYID